MDEERKKEAIRKSITGLLGKIKNIQLLERISRLTEYLYIHEEDQQMGNKKQKER